MNVKLAFTQTLVLAALAAASNVAMADDVTVVNDKPVSLLTRADARANLVQARSQGQLLRAGEFVVVTPQAMIASGLTRAQVINEVRADNRVRLSSVYSPG